MGTRQGRPVFSVHSRPRQTLRFRLPPGAAVCRLAMVRRESQTHNDHRKFARVPLHERFTPLRYVLGKTKVMWNQVQHTRVSTLALRILGEGRRMAPFVQPAFLPMNDGDDTSVSHWFGFRCLTTLSRLVLRTKSDRSQNMVEPLRSQFYTCNTPSYHKRIIRLCSCDTMRPTQL